MMVQEGVAGAKALGKGRAAGRVERSACCRSHRTYELGFLKSQLFAQRTWRWWILWGGVQSRAEGKNQSRHFGRTGDVPPALHVLVTLSPHSPSAPNLANIHTSTKQLCPGSGSWIYMAR